MQDVILKYNRKECLCTQPICARSAARSCWRYRAPCSNVLGLRPGAKVGIAIERGRLVVEPPIRPRYTLDELLAQCDSKARRTKEGREWLDDQPVGRELI